LLSRPFKLWLKHFLVWVFENDLLLFCRRVQIEFNLLLLLFFLILHLRKSLSLVNASNINLGSLNAWDYPSYVRSILVFIAHFHALNLPRGHRLVPVHCLLYQISGHRAVLNLMPNFFPRIFEVLLHISPQISGLSWFQILAIVVILSPHDVLDELLWLLFLLRISVAVKLS
jgi:hypothetical protein